MLNPSLFLQFDSKSFISYLTRKNYSHQDKVICTLFCRDFKPYCRDCRIGFSRITDMADLRRRPVSSAQDSNPDTTTSAAIASNSDPDPPIPPRTSPSISQRAISQTLQTTANLANLLPTGTLLAFQLLTPIFTNNGSCDAATRPMTFILLSILACSGFLASFTDSFKASDGQVYYGFATLKGLWLFDYPAAAASGIPDDLSKYRLTFIDVVHAALSVLVFVAVALKDKNVLSCFYPSPGHETQEVLDIVPIGIGLISSLLFVVFPTRRHGIGYPVTRDQ